MEEGGREGRKKRTYIEPSLTQGAAGLPFDLSDELVKINVPPVAPHDFVSRQGKGEAAGEVDHVLQFPWGGEGGGGGGGGRGGGGGGGRVEDQDRFLLVEGTLFLGD